MPQTFEHQLPSRLEAIRALLDSVEAWGEGAGLTPKATFRLNMILDELATNVVMHGYNGADGTVDIRIVDDGTALTVTLRDHAAEFDPFAAAPKADIDEPMHTRRIGGLGVHLVKQMAQSYSYRRAGAMNEVVVKLSRAP